MFPATWCGYIQVTQSLGQRVLKHPDNLQCKDQSLGKRVLKYPDNLQCNDQGGSGHLLSTGMETTLEQVLPSSRREVYSGYHNYICCCFVDVFALTFYI